jgi:ketosteroid isomerase-like protein
MTDRHVWLGALIAVVVSATPVARAGQTAPRPEPSVDLPSELGRVLRDYEAAWSSRDAAALARLFAEDGFVLPSNRPPVRGRHAIEKHYTGSGGALALRALAYAAEGSVGYIIGAYAEKPGDPDIGKFTLTLRKGADGRWLIMSDMDSSNGRRPQAFFRYRGTAPAGVDGGAKKASSIGRFTSIDFV